MKKTFWQSCYHISFSVIIGASLFFMMSCTKTHKQPDNKDQIQIMTTINPYYLITRQIVQDKASVNLFIPANASPHTYSPAPSDIIKLERSALVIANGLALEQQLAAKLDSMKSRVFWAAQSLPVDKLLTFDEHEEKEVAAEHKHTGIDPHIWLDPENLILIARAITDRLIILFPDEQHFIERNWKILDDNIKQVNNEITSERTHYQSPSILTFHNSFGYFLHRYQINLAGVIEQSPGKEPTSRELLALKDITKNVKAIFIEPQLNPRAAEIIAKEYKLLVDTLDPLGFLFKAANINDILWKNWNIMKKYFTVIPAK